MKPCRVIHIAAQICWWHTGFMSRLVISRYRLNCMRKSYHGPVFRLTQHLNFSFHLPKKPFNMDITKPAQHPTMFQCNLAYGTVAGPVSRRPERCSHLHHVYNQPQKTDTPVSSTGNNPSLYQVFRLVIQRSSNINSARVYGLLLSFGCSSNWCFPSLPT